MSAMEVTSFLVLVVYMVSFAGLTAARTKLSGSRPWFLACDVAISPWLGRIYVGAMGLAAALPLARTWIGDPYPTDPVRLALDGIATDIIGHVLMGIGACVAMVSQMHASNLWQMGTQERSADGLIEDGPYALSRNPVFLGQLVLFGGLFLVLPGTLQGVLTAALFATIFVRVRIEERWFGARYGEDYTRYRRRVPRWIGRLNIVG